MKIRSFSDPPTKAVDGNTEEMVNFCNLCTILPLVWEAYTACCSTFWSFVRVEVIPKDRSLSLYIKSMTIPGYSKKQRLVQYFVILCYNNFKSWDRLFAAPFLEGEKLKEEEDNNLKSYFNHYNLSFVQKLSKIDFCLLFAMIYVINSDFFPQKKFNAEVNNRKTCSNIHIRFNWY